MSTTDIRSILKKANTLVEASAKPSDTKGALARYLLPKHDPTVARIRLIEWLNGSRTPTDFGVMTRIAAWVDRGGKTPLLPSKKAKGSKTAGKR